MHVAIIGAGAAGLAAARHVQNDPSGSTCEIFEQNGQLGGTWVYTEKVGTDEHGFAVHSSMYQGLRTNLPKEVMGYPDFPVPEQEKSYLSQEEILKFLNMYADHFNLRPNIKFFKHVKCVKPLKKNRWSITTIDVHNLEQTTKEFDAIMICNGHYSTPYIPKLPNQDMFEGIQLHSHCYRKPSSFEMLKVLILGAGPSGMDLTLQISNVAKKVILSHRSEQIIKTIFPANVELKPTVKEITKRGVKFSDNTYTDVDAIIYCTGYKYAFPFLHNKCGITVDENYIKPLYKHMINIKYPTMCLIGIPFNVCAFQMFDLQVRYFLQSLNGSLKLPTKEQMYVDTETDMSARWAKGYTKRQAHLMGLNQLRYYTDLANAANIKPIAPVIVKLRDESVQRIMDDLIYFRNDVYKIIDDENYIKVN